MLIGDHPLWPRLWATVGISKHCCCITGQYLDNTMYSVQYHAWRLVNMYLYQYGLDQCGLDQCGLDQCGLGQCQDDVVW